MIFASVKIINITSVSPNILYENRDSLTMRSVKRRNRSDRFPRTFSHGRAKLAWKVKLVGNPLCSNLIPALLHRRKRQERGRKMEEPLGTLNFDFAQARSADCVGNPNFPRQSPRPPHAGLILRGIIMIAITIILCTRIEPTLVSTFITSVRHRVYAFITLATIQTVLLKLFSCCLKTKL